VYIYGSYRKIKTGVPLFLDHSVYAYVAILTSTAAYNFTGDAGVNCSQKFKVFHSFHQIFNNGD